jgi:hypothetical protein
MGSSNPVTVFWPAFMGGMLRRNISVASIIQKSKLPLKSG